MGKAEVASVKQESATKQKKGTKAEESGGTDVKQHVKQKKYQTANGGQESTSAPDGEEPVAKKDAGKVKKAEVASVKQESATKQKKGTNAEESGATDIQKHVKQKKYQTANGGQEPTSAPGGEPGVGKHTMS